MGVVRRVVALGRALRKREQVRVRQPLSTLTVVTRDADAAAAVDSHTALLGEELNVKAVVVERDESDLVHLSAKANFKELGPRLGPRVKDVAGAIADLDHDSVDRIIDGATIEVLGEPIALADITVARDPRPGVVVAGEASFSVALDTEITPELHREGLAREVISRVQSLRRAAGLDVSDRIVLRWSTTAEQVRDAMAAHAGLIAGEVLAASVSEGTPDGGDDVDVDGESLRLAVTAAD
jgi:isoleucyl-tRNA synthetase